MDVAGYLDKFYREARLLVHCIERERRAFAGTSRTHAIVKASKAVLAACPFRDGEYSSVGIINRLANVSAVLVVVQPLVCVVAAVCNAISVEDTNGVAWVYVSTGSAFLVLAKPELAHLVRDAI